MTTSPLPWTAVGETLYDARGNPIATFKDYRDAEALIEYIEKLKKRLVPAPINLSLRRN